MPTSTARDWLALFVRKKGAAAAAVVAVLSLGFRLILYTWYISYLAYIIPVYYYDTTIYAWYRV